jgi:DNA-binding GntR family transcriptional regulator
LALKPAYRRLSLADFDRANDLARRISRTNNARDHFEYHSQFWDGIFSKAQRPILYEVFRQLNDRGTRYEPLLLKLFPPGTRPRQREVLIEIYRKGKIAEAFLAFKRTYLEIVDQVINHLNDEEIDGFSR